MIFKKPDLLFFLLFSSIICSEKRDTSDDLTIFLPKTIALCTVTGAISASLDHFITWPIGFLTEIKIRKMILEEIVFKKIDQKSYTRQKKIAAWFGWGASWASYIVVGKMLQKI